MIAICAKRKVVVAALLLLSLTILNNTFAAAHWGLLGVDERRQSASVVDVENDRQPIHEKIVKYLMWAYGVGWLFPTGAAIVNNDALGVVTGSSMVGFYFSSASIYNKQKISIYHVLRNISWLCTMIGLLSIKQSYDAEKANRIGILTFGIAACTFYLHTKMLNEENAK